MREQREKLSEKLSKMTKEEIVEYFKRKKFDSSVRPMQRRAVHPLLQACKVISIFSQRGKLHRTN